MTELQGIKDNIVQLIAKAEVLSDGKAEANPGSFSAEGNVKPPEGGDQGINLRCSGFALTDLGNVDRFLFRHGEDFRYVESWGWVAWNGKIWVIDGAEAILQRAIMATIVAIADEATALKYSDADFVAEHKGTGPVLHSDKVRKWGLASQGSAHISCVAKHPTTHLASRPEEFDADLTAFNVANVTLRFKHNETADYVTFHPHRREDRITKIAPVIFDPNAQAPLYAAFLERVQPNAGMQRHLHAWGGISLTGLPEAHLSFWYGTGRNGKSTLIDTWSYVMGDYAQTIPIESFLDQGRSRRGGEASPDIASLASVHCLRTSEPEKRSKLAESMVKLVTGGEPLRARQLNRNFFEFRPCFKMTMQGNYKPRIDGTDEGIWARILLVPWTVMIPEGERDPELPSKLKQEASGILNRLLDGLRDYLDNGLLPPAEVIEATADYREESDPIQRFLNECVSRHPPDSHWRSPGQELYRLYKVWTKANGEHPWNAKSFSRGLQDHGIQRLKSSKAFYLGIEMTKTTNDFSGLSYEDTSDDDRNHD